jgi:NADH dehydrogenase
MEDVEVVVSAVHGFVGPRGVTPATIDRQGNANLIDAAKSSGAHLVLMSVVGAAPDSPMELFRMKHAAEQHAVASGIPRTIVRSTAFAELWVELLRSTAARSGRPLVFGRGDNPINFVSVVDVAALVERAVVDPATRGNTLEIGGPDNLTFNQLARAVQDADGRAGRARHVPIGVLRVMADTVGRLKPQVGRQARAAIAMDTVDLIFDAATARDAFPDLPCTTVAQVLAVNPQLVA